jgi:broad specificity phosphatase PhoE
MTTIILTRHGHVEGIVPERFRGRRDLPLTELGKRHAELTAQRIASSWRPAAIYSSPLGRCIDTGNAAGAAKGADVHPEARLNDMDYGAWEGLTPDEARSRWKTEVALRQHPT